MDLGRGPRPISGRIEERKLPDAARSREQRPPEIRNVRPDGGHGSDSRDQHAPALFHSAEDCDTPSVSRLTDTIRRMSDRLDWHTYFMNIARQVATRATCPRKHVGALIVRDRTILSTGYNGSIRGMPHCDDAGHDLEAGHCVATIHAEANAILQAAKNGVTIDGAEIYTTASPCWSCFKLIDRK